MRKAIIIACIAAFTIFSGCGRIEDDKAESSLAESTETDISVTVPPDNAPDDGSDTESVSEAESTADESSVLSIDINTYHAEDVPELTEVINDTLEGAAGELEDFDKVFDEDLIIEVLVRSSIKDEDEIKKTLDGFTEDIRAKTVEQDYNILHEPLVNDPCEGEIEDLTIQCYNQTLDDAMTFNLNFSIKCRDGKVKFIGNAYKLNGKWGAMFEPTENGNSEEQLDSLLTEGE